MILLVDDNADLVRGLTALLRNDGYDVRSLPNGATVAEAVALYKPDLLVLDAVMPVVDGWEALRRVRENPSNSWLPVMMFVGGVLGDAERLAGSIKPDDFMPKPFSVTEFRDRVDALVSRSFPDHHESEHQFPVVDDSGTASISADDVTFVQGVRNYAYIHTYDSRFLGKLSLGEIEGRHLPGFMRVHRSYIVRLGAVKGYRWASKSSFKLVMDDAAVSDVPVSRKLIREVRGKVDH
jgi:DNA-binding LytR/AlgR family response regulator